MSSRSEFPMQGGCDPLRQCALVLHSIRAEDRAWLLANLKGALVPELEQLLGELRALGIPADPAATQTVLQCKSAAGKSQEQPDSSSIANGDPTDLQRFRAKAIGELLRHEPAGLLARVIGLREPAEQKTILAHVHAAKRRQLKTFMSSPEGIHLAATMAPRSVQAMEEQLSLRLARRHEAASAPVATAIMRGTLRLLRMAKLRS
jgi:hypothetical protein